MTHKCACRSRKFDADFQQHRKRIFYLQSKRNQFGSIRCADWTLWSYLQMLNPCSDRMIELPEVSEVAAAIYVSERLVWRSLKKLQEIGLLPTWVVLRNQVHNSIENQVCDRLRMKVGEPTEVSFGIKVTGEEV